MRICHPHTLSGTGICLNLHLPPKHQPFMSVHRPAPLSVWDKVCVWCLPSGFTFVIFVRIVFSQAKPPSSRRAVAVFLLDFWRFWDIKCSYPVEKRCSFHCFILFFLITKLQRDFFSDIKLECQNSCVFFVKTFKVDPRCMALKKSQTRSTMAILRVCHLFLGWWKMRKGDPKVVNVINPTWGIKRSLSFNQPGE